MNRLELYHKLETPDYEPDDPKLVIERKRCWRAVAYGFVAGVVMSGALCKLFM